MRLAIASDLHLDSYDDDMSRLIVLRRIFIKREFDVAIVAGDLSNSRGWNCIWKHALALLMDELEGKPVVMVLGNHDWSQAMSHTFCAREFDWAREKYAGRLHLLDRSTCEIDGQRFVGFTNWYDPHPKVTREDKTWYDYRTIRGHAKRIFKEHAADVEFAKCIIPSDVVVTHMLPHKKCIAEKYRGSSSNKYFYSEKPQVDIPKAWVYGHTHTISSIDNCHARPVGYAGEIRVSEQMRLPRVIEV